MLKYLVLFAESSISVIIAPTLHECFEPLPRTEYKWRFIVKHTAEYNAHAIMCAQRKQTYSMCIILPQEALVSKQAVTQTPMLSSGPWAVHEKVAVAPRAADVFGEVRRCQPDGCADVSRLSFH